MYRRTRPLEEALAGGQDNCARCGNDHAVLMWRKFQRPVELDDGSRMQYWATCPDTGDPILLHVVEQAEEVEEASVG